MKSDLINLKSVISNNNNSNTTSANKYSSISENIKKDDFVPVFSLSPKFASKNTSNNNSVSVDPDKLSTTPNLPNNANVDIKKQPDSDGIPKSLFPGCGIVITLFASLFFSISTACVKEAGLSQAGMNGVEMAFFRGLFLAMFAAIIQISRGQSLWVPREELLINFLRGFFGSVAVFGLYMSMRYITLADASAISFSAPIWTFILSYFILKERMSWLQLIPLPASIIGVLMISHPDLFNGPNGLETPTITEELLNEGLVLPDFVNSTDPFVHPNRTHSGVNGSTFVDYSNTSLGMIVEDVETDAERIYGIILALVGAISMGATNIVLKFRKKTPVQTVIFWFGLCTSTIAFGLMTSYSGYVWPDRTKVWLLIVGNCSLSWLGQCLYQVAFYFEAATIISLIRSMDVVVSFVISALFLNEHILWTSIVGASMTVGSVASLMILKWFQSTRQ